MITHIVLIAFACCLVSQVQLEVAKNQACAFDESYQALRAHLSTFEEAQRNAEPVHSEVTVVKQQLEAHKVHTISNGI